MPHCETHGSMHHTIVPADTTQEDCKTLLSRENDFFFKFSPKLTRKKFKLTAQGSRHSHVAQPFSSSLCPWGHCRHLRRGHSEAEWFVVVCGGLWGFLGVCGGLWWFVVVCGGLWGFVGVFGGLWWFVMVCGGLWWFVVVCGGFWGFVVVCDGLWWFVVVCGGLWWVVVVHGGL